ncbi:FAD-binding oxidoreductase [Actinopolymorpha sp. B17G11]|uniref:NAD(P)/FAD-dependent oxidoreductase n=1 Tax=Actinopolymorpha sp. B17G11 TaxID=3160861 RepID=UPI0032E52CA7
MPAGFSRTPVDVVVVGAGVVGAACAYYSARAGLAVAVVDAAGIAGGTTGAGEGNLLVSDKEPGPELALALRSLALWRELDGDLGCDSGFEYERKGGVVVAESAEAHARLEAFAAGQRAAGITAEPVRDAELADLEPRLAPGLPGGIHYPQDAQVQPMLAAAALLRAARAHGATVHPHTRVTALERDRHGRVTGVVTTGGTVAAGAVVNAAGTWGGEVAVLAGVEVPILPRRGFVLVTEPLPPMVRHKVYSAEYVANVASSSPDLETSAVVEGTASGTILIGASRERVGFDRTLSLRVLQRLATQAVRLFPFLAGVSAIRAYRGFRPYAPDHLPVIGHDPRAPGLFHACGHEGAGVGLAPVTGSVVAALLTGQDPGLDVRPFRPERFDSTAVPA